MTYIHICVYVFTYVDFHMYIFYLYIGLVPLPRMFFVTTRIMNHFLGSGIPIINLHFHYYWEGGQLKF